MNENGSSTKGNAQVLNGKQWFSEASHKGVRFEGDCCQGPATVAPVLAMELKRRGAGVMRATRPTARWTSAQCFHCSLATAQICSIGDCLRVDEPVAIQKMMAALEGPPDG